MYAADCVAVGNSEIGGQEGHAHNSHQSAHLRVLHRHLLVTEERFRGAPNNPQFGSVQSMVPASSTCLQDVDIA